MKFFPDFSLHLQNKVLLLHHQNLLSYGVTVTQQILVLLFLVRIQVAQHKERAADIQRRVLRYCGRRFLEAESDVETDGVGFQFRFGR